MAGLDPASSDGRGGRGGLLSLHLMVQDATIKQSHDGCTTARHWSVINDNFMIIISFCRDLFYFCLVFAFPKSQI